MQHIMQSRSKRLSNQSYTERPSTVVPDYSMRMEAGLTPRELRARLRT